MHPSMSTVTMSAITDTAIFDTNYNQIFNKNHL